MRGRARIGCTAAPSAPSGRADTHRVLPRQAALLRRADHYRSHARVEIGGMKRSTLLLVALLALAFLTSLAAGKVWIGPADWFADTANGWIMAEL
ncbi:MAG: hypothetical protein CFE32_19875, partial [Alphaproteobacteria bacterium PA3]